MVFANLKYVIHINFLIIIWCTSSCSSSNILGIFYHGGRSHQILGEVLFKELARRGHNVTMASAFPLETPLPNYTDIHLTGILEDQISREQLYLEMNSNIFATLGVFDMTRTQTEITLCHENMQNLVKSGIKFDLIVIDWFLCYSLLIYGYLFDAPVILISSAGSFLTTGVVGNPVPPSFVPNSFLPLTSNLTFLQRIVNSFAYIACELTELSDINYHKNLIKKYYKNAPQYEELQNRVALVLSNAHYTFESPRPYVPNIIPVGGFHIQESKGLPNDLQRIMDESIDGVIYFSLGSIMKSKILPDETVRSIVSAFSKINQTVLWKWEDDKIPNLPKNVIVRKWLSQNDILAHPNIKLFITHGGRLSTIEAIYHAVPVIGIPIFGDQKSNVPQAVASGYAIQLELRELSEKTLFEAIKEIISNSRYTENVQKLSNLLKEQPMKPMDTAIYWVEHVIKHKGAPHLKNTGTYLYWYQYMLIDVAVLLASIIFVIFYILRYCLQKVSHFFDYILTP